RHDQAVQVALALDGPAVLVRRVAESDVHGAQRLLRLSDLVTDPRRWVQADPDLTDVVRIRHCLDDGAKPVRGRASLDRDGATLAYGDPDRRFQRSEVGRDAFPNDDPLRGA